MVTPSGGRVGGGGELDKPYLHSTGEERGLEDSKTGRRWPGEESVQARWGRGHGEAPSGCETTAGGMGWLDTWVAPPVSSLRAFLLCGSHSSSQDTYKDRPHREPWFWPVL